MENKRPVVPKEHQGKWIAWNHANTKILATSDSFAAARQAARDKGERRPWMMKTPSGLFVGRA